MKQILLMIAVMFRCLFVVFLASFLIAESHAQDSKKPNVLFIAIDDLNDWVGVFGGHPQAKTPNMDKLAKRDGGIIFDMAYCPASVCGPSRSSLLSGIRPSNSGVYGNS